MRQQDHQRGQDKEDHRRVGNLVPDPFDTVEELLQKYFWVSAVSCAGTTRLCSLISANPSPKLQSKIELFNASCCFCSKFAAGFLLHVESVSRIPEHRPQASWATGATRVGTVSLDRPAFGTLR
jgi:hypothetical protein